MNIRQLKGLTDKRYWRPTVGLYHCFKRCSDLGGEMRYLSLCQRFAMPRCGGQKTNRPPSIRRCALCDVREAARVSSDTCLPDSPDFDPISYDLRFVRLEARA